jgi:hypothetical protein
MDVQAKPPSGNRDLRLDLFRGLANWAIFLNHMPENVVNWITTRNFGFSDAADLFVFISGYTASLVYARMMRNRGFVVAATRLFKRVWQLYIAHIVLFVTYIAAIALVARNFNNSEIVHQFNVAGLVHDPIGTLSQGLLLKLKPLNLDILPVYIVLMASFPPVLWMLLQKPDFVLAGSLALYVVARQLSWNLPSYPEGVWYFNPFAWQLLFVFGGWCALGGLDGPRSKVFRSTVLVWLSVAYLLFALLMTMALRFPELASLLPVWLLDTFKPDKTNLAPHRFAHFIAMAFLAAKFIPKDWPALKSQIFAPAIKCGQQSLAVFCVGTFLSFIGHFALTISSGSLLVQILIATTGIAAMTVVAYYISWSKRQDKLGSGVIPVSSLEQPKPKAFSPP